MSTTSAEALLALAESFVGEGCFLQAIKCLEAICQSDVAFLPLIQAKARVRLANILLDHTDNPFKAKEALEQAQLLVSDVPSTFHLKMRLQSELGRYYMTTGEVSMQKQVAKRALKLVGQQKGDERAGALPWHTHFSLRLANALVTEGSMEDAKVCVQEAQRVVREGGEAKAHAMLSLCEAQLLLDEGNDAEIKASLSGCLQHVSAVEDALEGEGDPFVEQLGMHLLLLQTLFLIRNGELAAANKVLQGVNEKMKALEALPPAYKWLSNAEMWTLICLISVACLRPQGKFQQCTTNIAKGLAVVAEEFERMGIGADGCESRLSLHTIWEARALLFFKFLLLESSVLIALTQSDMDKAGAELTEMADLAARFPTLLHDGAASLHTAVGLYCHALGQLPEAGRHFDTARGLSRRTGVQSMCAIFSALVAMSPAEVGEGGGGGGGAAAESRAHELLGPLFRGYEDLPGHGHRAAVLFATGLLSHQQGNAMEAKSRLSRALKLSHTELVNHQLTSQVLNVLGRLVMEAGDTGQAHDMLTSSYTLSKSFRDIHTQMGVLAPLSDLYRATGDAAKEATTVQAQGRRVAELQAAVAAALGKNAARHKALVGFAWPAIA